MKISIVIPAFNEERLLAESLACVNACRAAFKRASFESELIVCDNNSTDRTAEIARAAGRAVEMSGGGGDCNSVRVRFGQA